MINTGSSEDMWFTPKVLSRRRGHYVDDTLFVYGLYSPFHFSHYLYNGLIPLYSTIREYHGHNPWLLRVKTYWNEHTPLDMNVLPSSSDIVLEKRDVLTHKQRLPPYTPMCFSKAVVGTGNRCSLWYCENTVPHDDYMAFREDVFRLPMDASNPCLHSVIQHGTGNKTHIAILNREKSRHITNVPELVQSIIHAIPEATIHLINFDEGCDIRSTASLVEHMDVLIAPFGNGLGAGLFMTKPDAIVISINARWYSESWFYWPMTSIGVRLYSFECARSSCQEYEPALVRKLSPNISYDDMMAVMTDSNPLVDWSITTMYRKDVSRRVDIERFIPFLQHKLNTSAYDCDDMCQPAMQRNSF